jgi:hypothetical protein
MMMLDLLGVSCAGVGPRSRATPLRRRDSAAGRLEAAPSGAERGEERTQAGQPAAGYLPRNRSAPSAEEW